MHLVEEIAQNIEDVDCPGFVSSNDCMKANKLKLDRRFDFNGDDFYKARKHGLGRIELYLRGEHSDTVGIFRCRMPDGTEGNFENIYIGIYQSHSEESMGKLALISVCKSIISMHVKMDATVANSHVFILI